MPQNPEHAYRQGPFEPLQDYRGHRLLGRYVPPGETASRADAPEDTAGTEGAGVRGEYHVEVHRDGRVAFWTVSYLPADELPSGDVGAAEEHLLKDARAYARELIDTHAEPREAPYRRRAGTPETGAEK